MRFAKDQIWVLLKSAYLRIAFSRFTIAFFLFGFVHCFAQGIIQSFLFSVDSDSASLVASILSQAHLEPQHEIAWLTDSHDGYRLQLCSHIPYGQAASPCMTIFESGQSNGNITLSSESRRSDTSSGNSGNSISGRADVLVTTVSLDQQCANVLLYPNQTLQNYKREDVVFICVQFWLFFISFIAVVYNSVPHTLAVLCARVLTTAWSAYSIWRLGNLELRFHALVTGADSPCKLQLFAAFFDSRRKFQIADLVLNCTALLISALLSCNLLKVYREHTFKRVGPPPAINRIYRLFLALFVCLQLSGFLLVTAMGLWIDQLFNTAIMDISSHTTIYIALFIFTSVFLLPWIALGWFSARRENKRHMIIFLMITFTFVACWSIMFYSEVYRWQFVQWPLFACITLEAFIVMIASFVFGILSWRNFDKGLSHYLYVERVLSFMDFEHEVFPHDMEKSLPL